MILPDGVRGSGRIEHLRWQHQGLDVELQQLQWRWPEALWRELLLEIFVQALQHFFPRYRLRPRRGCPGSTGDIDGLVNIRHSLLELCITFKFFPEFQGQISFGLPAEYRCSLACRLTGRQM